MPEHKKKQINIEFDENVAEGIFSNLAMITHSSSEFVVDFIKLLPGVPKAKVKARIILTPQHAKMLYRALKDNIQKFESMYGNIDVPEGGDILPPFNMGGPTAEA